MIGVKPQVKRIIESDRLKIMPFVAIAVMLSVSSLLGYAVILPDLADRQNLAAMIGANPAFNILFGRATDLTTTDGFNAWRILALGSMFAALMTIFLVIRNTRGAEEGGQGELVASLPVARTSRLASALIAASIASVLLGTVTFLVSLLVGGGALPTALICAGFALSGMMFAGVAGLAAQVGAQAPTATGLAVGFLGIAYVVRGYSDASADMEWLTWASPLGWISETRPAGENRWWPLALCVLFIAATYTAALAMERRRDFGGALLAQKPGPERAQGLSTSLGGFITRINVGSWLGWLAALALVGYMFGNIGATVGQTLSRNPAMAEYLARGAVTEEQASLGFISMILSILGMLAAVAGIGVFTRMHREEIGHRLEVVLATRVHRGTYLGITALIALLTTGLCLVVAGGTMAFAVSRGDAAVSGSVVFQQALVTIPASWLVLSVGALGVALGTRTAFLGWVAVVVSFAITMFGPMFKAPQWLMNFSPYDHIPAMAATNPDLAPAWWLLGITALVFAAAFAVFRRRDVA